MKQKPAECDCWHVCFSHLPSFRHQRITAEISLLCLFLFLLWLAQLLGASGQDDSSQEIAQICQNVHKVALRILLPVRPIRSSCLTYMHALTGSLTGAIAPGLCTLDNFMACNTLHM